MYDDDLERADADDCEEITPRGPGRNRDHGGAAHRVACGQEHNSAEEHADGAENVEGQPPSILLGGKLRGEECAEQRAGVPREVHGAKGPAAKVLREQVRDECKRDGDHDSEPRSVGSPREEEGRGRPCHPDQRRGHAPPDYTPSDDASTVEASGERPRSDGDNRLCQTARESDGAEELRADVKGLTQLLVDGRQQRRICLVDGEPDAHQDECQLRRASLKTLAILAVPTLHVGMKLV